MGKRQQSDMFSKMYEATHMKLRKGELEARLKRVNEDLEPLMEMSSKLDIVTDRLSADAAMYLRAHGGLLGATPPSNCLLSGGTTTDCLLVGGSTTNVLLVR